MPLKAFLKGMLQQVGLYDPDLRRLALDKIRSDDVFLCSYPKSGNTWVRFIIANLLRPNVQITFRNIDDVVPAIEKNTARVHRLNRRRIMKTHWPLFHRFPKCVYVCRDPRDALISYYHYSRNNGWFDGDLSDFLRSGVPEEYTDWGTHVAKALAECRRRPKGLCFIKYEKLLKQPCHEAARLNAFLEIGAAPAQIEDAVQKTSFENLRDMEMQYGPETDGDALGFFREGKARQWETSMTVSDQQLILNRFGQAMALLDYT